MENLLKARLEPVIRRHRWRAIGWQLAACWALAALVGFGLLLLQWQTGWTSPLVRPLLVALAGGGAFAIVARHYVASSDYREIARRIEQRIPELKGLLLTAVQQELPKGGTPGFLQYRVLQQALEHSGGNDWRNLVPRWRLFLAHGVNLAAFGLLFLALSGLQPGGPDGTDRTPLLGVAVTPGDALIERGESLVVLARFGGRLPVGVDMVVHSSGAVPQKIALVKSLADPVFGARIPEVDQDLTYHLEYGGKTTRDYKITVFEKPRLERADAVLTYPSYTGMAQKRIENTSRVSAVEGTHLDLALQLNKPVASARLVAHDAKKTVVPLQVVADKAVASLPQFPLIASQTYDLQLVDGDGRANAPSAPFVFNVLPDRPPELHVTSPRGDMRPSAVEEVQFSGTVLGDFGVPAYGLSYTVAGGETKTIELGHSVPAMEKRPFQHTLSLEDLGVQPDQLISWYVWADDTGPDGKPRRTEGDLFFAEIRPFDEIFRESQQMQSPDDQQDGSQGQGNDNRRLADLEKQIISATWKLQRDPSEPKYPGDAKVVHDSQQQALTQAGSEQENAEDPRTKALWAAAIGAMGKALTQLQTAEKSPEALAPALSSEQAASQALLKLQPRDTQVARGRGSRGGGGQQDNQSQLDQLDLTQEQNRYETQKQAAPVESPQRREQLEVMNRLQELAKRQQDVNGRLKELQTALQEARTDQQKEDIRQQLKRLQDEQQQMVADVDELRQRMDRQEDQSTMSDQSRQLDQTRSDAQKAADAAGQGNVAQALDAGTRAQRQFQDMHDQLHKQNSDQFSDDLRDLRSEAREIASQEDGIAKKLEDASSDNQRKTLTDAPERADLSKDLDQQKKRMTDLVDKAKQISQQAEDSEPLLAQKLYDSLRKLGQDDAGTTKEFQQELLSDGLLTRNLNDRLTDTTGAEGTKSLDLTSALLQEGYMPKAGEAEQRARAGINELKDGVEGAAKSVIGDDAEALKLAESELDTATDQLQRESAQAQGKPAQQVANAQSKDAQQAADSPNGAQASGSAAEPGGTTSLSRRSSAETGVSAAAFNQGQSPSQTQSGANGAAPSRQAGPRSLAGGGENQTPTQGAPDPLGIANLVDGGGNRNPDAPAAAANPITGDGYGAWSDHLRDVEEMVDFPDLRNAVANAREHARLLRQDYTRNGTKPDWKVVQEQVVNPLIEVRNQISDELARRGSRDSLVPIDRDPVPNRYAESVRKYYEELGKDQ